LGCDNIAHIHFSIATYQDYADCDVAPIQACYLLLGRPGEFDTDVVPHGRSNKYTLMHKGKKITLLSLTPNEIVQCDRSIAKLLNVNMKFSMTKQHHLRILMLLN
jgi:hypothetical protein